MKPLLPPISPVVGVTLVFALAVPGPSSRALAGATLAVADCGDTTPGGAPGQLRRLIGDAAPGDTIIVPACTITLTGAADEDANATGDLDILKSLSIQGAGPGLTVIDGGAIDRILHINNAGAVAISGLTLRNGRAGGGAPPMWPPGNGGGIFNSGSLTTISDTVLSGNVARNAGGIDNEETGTLQISRSTFTSNSAGGGGGAIMNRGSATITGSTLAANYAVNGGGILTYGPLTITASTVSGNEAFNTGGGIALFSSSSLLTVIACTITGNRANTSGDDFGNGGGIELALADSSLPLLRNTIVAENFKSATERGDIFGTLQASSSFNLIGVDTGLAGISNGANGNKVGTGAAPLDPLLDPLGLNGGPSQTHALRAGSPAIDAGTIVGASTTDQRGWPRPMDGDGDGVAAGDIGAYERLSTVFADVDTAYWARAWIEALSHAGITSGCSQDPPFFCPEAAVMRGQMAVFLLRSKDGGDHQPPPCTVPTFGDVPCSHMFAAWIEELFSREVTTGCSANPPLYCPESAVTRGQMAVFLLRMLMGSSYTPPACQGLFADLPCTDAFATWAEDLFERGVTSGCSANPLRYCPDNAVTRAQMAVFLVRTFGLPL